MQGMSDLIPHFPTVLDEPRIYLSTAQTDICRRTPLLSHLVLRKGEKTAAQVRANPDKRCSRCWRHKPSVGRSALHSELCDRCEDVLANPAL